MGVTVIVHTFDGELTIDLCDTEEQFKSITVQQLKSRIVERIYGHHHQGTWVGLSFEGKDLDGDSLLSEYGIQHMSVIHITTISQTHSGTWNRSMEEAGDF